jgi:hypothetical protein
MIARLWISLPFHITVPEGEVFNVYEYDDSGYKIRIYPPRRSQKAPPLDGETQMSIDGVNAFQADLLNIEFMKENFDRNKNGPIDPSEDLINRVANSFLLRLRHVTKAPQVRMIDISSSSWQLDYQNDDGTELNKKEGFIRSKAEIKHSLSWLVFNKEIWNDMHKLPENYEPPPWEGLILDARQGLPSVGPSIF